MQSRILPTASLLFASALIITACGAGTSADNGSVPIGLISAEQGPFAFAGGSYLKGAKLAETLLNEGGNKIKLVVEEGSEDPAKSITAFNKLASQHKAAGVVCCISSAVAGALKPLATQKEVPLIVYGATAPDVEDPPFVYRPALLPQQGIKPVATELVKSLQPATAIHVTASDNDGLVAQSKAASAATEAAGAKNLGTVNTLLADTDFSGTVTKILSKKPEMVTVYTLGEQAATIVKSLREKDYKGIILANNAVATGPNLKSFGKALADTYFSVEYTPGSDVEEAVSFTKAYKKEYGETPDVFASQGFVAVNYVAKGLELDAAASKTALGASLEKITEMDTVWGPIKFQNGQGIAEKFQIVKIDDTGTPKLWTGQ